MIKGSHHSPESKKKLSSVLTGKIRTPEQCKHIKENHADFKGEKNYWYGKHLSDEHKQKLSKGTQANISQKRQK